jgi:hypothetical protein
MADVAEFAPNGLLRRELEAEPMDAEQVNSLLDGPRRQR